MTIVQAMLPRPALAGGGLTAMHSERATTSAIDEGQDAVPVHVGALRINIRYDHFGAAPEGEQAAVAGALHNISNDNSEAADDPPAADQIRAVTANVVNISAGAATPQEGESLVAIAVVPVSVVAAEADSEVAGLLGHLKAAMSSNGGSGGAITISLASLAKSIEDGVVAIGEWIFKAFALLGGGFDAFLLWLCEDTDKATAKDAHFQACAPVPLEEPNELKVDQQEEGRIVAQMQGVLLNEGQARRIAEQNALLVQRATTIEGQAQRIRLQDQQLAVQGRELESQQADIVELQRLLAAQTAQSDAQQARLDAQAEEMRQIRQMLAMGRGL